MVTPYPSYTRMTVKSAHFVQATQSFSSGHLRRSPCSCVWVLVINQALEIRHLDEASFEEIHQSIKTVQLSRLHSGWVDLQNIRQRMA